MTTTASPGQLDRTRRRQRRAIVVGGASAAATAVWAVAGPLLGVDLVVRPGGSPQTVNAGFVIATSLLASALGWALLAILERRTDRARTIWTGIALAILVLSVGGPLTAGGAASTTTTLLVMHLAVGAVVIPGMRATAAAEPRSR